MGIKKVLGRGDTGRGAQGEDGRAKEPATMDASRTAKLTVGLRSARGEEERRERKNTIRPLSAKTGWIKGHKSWRAGDHGSRTGVVDWRANVAQVID